MKTLEHETNGASSQLRTLIFVQFSQGPSDQEDLSTAGLIKPRQQTKQRGLARS